MKVLVIGAGGREHALVWKLAQSPQVEKIFAAPGNGGTRELAENLPIGVDETVKLADFAGSNKIGLTVVRPAGPLVHGIVDYFTSRGLEIFGPTKAAARLEGSKVFSKQVMERFGVPTAASCIFKEEGLALDHLKTVRMPIVVKADGLAGGKGVVVAQTLQEAQQAVTDLLGQRIFGEAGAQVVIEECLVGEEVSVLAIVDGAHFLLLEPLQDHKRALDGDQGPNTGGMGAYSPVPMLDAAQIQQIRQKVFEPMVRGMAAEGTPFVGILYAGLMLTAAGPKVLEFNVRFGDPEAQAILPRLKGDLAQIFLAAVDGRVDRSSIGWDSRFAACVVLASQGYPGHYDMGRPITGIKEAADLPETLVFHAGTKPKGSNLLTAGGRVVSIVGFGETLESALGKAYRAADHVQFEGKQFRRDIGARALKYTKETSGRSL